MIKRLLSVSVIIFLLLPCSIISSMGLDIKEIEKPDNNLDINSNSFPEYWNWADRNGVDWTTPAKDQGRFPYCSTFCFISVFESMIKIRENCSEFNPDLSEQYVISCIFSEEVNGTTMEFCFPYKGRNADCSEKASNWKDYFVPVEPYFYIERANNDFIKHLLMEHGPVGITICTPPYINFILPFTFLGIWGKSHHSPDEYYSRNTLDIQGVDHWVTIVGWKDNPSIQNGGYWICKNSWGTDWGYNGFFNLEYGSLNSNLCEIIWFDYNPESYNWPPIGSPKIEGLTNIEANIEYMFNFSVIDPENDPIYYNVSWGDDSYSGWIGPYWSGETVTLSNMWAADGNYTVKFKTKNIDGPESYWMPEEKESNDNKNVRPIFNLINKLINFLDK